MESSPLIDEIANQNIAVIRQWSIRKGKATFHISPMIAISRQVNNRTLNYDRLGKQ